MAELIVITGGAYSGKTALVGELARLGHHVVPEAALEVIAELTREMGVEQQARWRRENQVEFQRLVTTRQHAREVEARAAPVPLAFSDRGALDGLAYCRLAGVAWPDDLRLLTADATYAHVFVLDTLEVFDPRPATGRVDTREASVRVAGLLEAIYRPRAARLTRMPQLSVVDRARRVLELVDQGPAVDL